MCNTKPKVLPMGGYCLIVEGENCKQIMRLSKNVYNGKKTHINQHSTFYPMPFSKIDFFSSF